MYSYSLNFKYTTIPKQSSYWGIFIYGNPHDLYRQAPRLTLMRVTAPLEEPRSSSSLSSTQWGRLRRPRSNWGSNMVYIYIHIHTYVTYGNYHKSPLITMKLYGLSLRLCCSASLPCVLNQEPCWFLWFRQQKTMQKKTCFLIAK